MDTTATPCEDGRRRRRRHSPEFKAHVVAACCKSGASMASVALTNGVNANLVRRWVLESDAAVNRPQLPNSTTKSLSVTPSFVPVQLPTTPAPADIRIEVTRGATQVAVTWPATAATECAAWMRELLR